MSEPTLPFAVGVRPPHLVYGTEMDHLRSHKNVEDWMVDKANHACHFAGRCFHPGVSGTGTMGSIKCAYMRRYGMYGERRRSRRFWIMYDDHHHQAMLPSWSSTVYNPDRQRRGAPPRRGREPPWRLR
jgi:hypothetical protein